MKTNIFVAFEVSTTTGQIPGHVNQSEWEMVFTLSNPREGTEISDAYFLIRVHCETA